jgi:hypothetical protein
MSNISIDELSQTISELIDLDLDQQSLIASAVDRAIAAKDITGGGRICPPIINGKIACNPPLTHPPISIRLCPPLVAGGISPAPKPETLIA